MAGMTEGNQHQSIEALSVEHRMFPPPAEFAASALASDRAMYDEAAADHEGFWARQASELVEWSQPWDTVLEWDLPYSQWFVGGQLNVAAN